MKIRGKEGARVPVNGSGTSAALEAAKSGMKLVLHLPVSIQASPAFMMEGYNCYLRKLTVYMVLMSTRYSSMTEMVAVVCYMMSIRTRYIKKWKRGSPSNPYDVRNGDIKNKTNGSKVRI